MCARQSHIQWCNIVNELNMEMKRNDFFDCKNKKVQTKSISSIVIIGVDAILIDSSNSIWFQSGLVLNNAMHREMAAELKLLFFSDTSKVSH